MNLRCAPSLLGIGSLALFASFAPNGLAATPTTQADSSGGSGTQTSTITTDLTPQATQQPADPPVALKQPTSAIKAKTPQPKVAGAQKLSAAKKLPAPSGKLPETSALPRPQATLLTQGGAAPTVPSATPTGNLVPFQQQNLDQLRDPVLNNLQANPNPLQFPTQPKEVRIETIQPLTLQQVTELAKQNSPLIQQAQLNVDKAQAGIDAAWAAYYPSLAFRANATRSGGGNGTTTLVGANRPSDNTSTGAFNFPTNYILNGNTNLRVSFDVRYAIYNPARQPNLNAAQGELRRAKLSYEQTWEELQQEVSRRYFDLQFADEGVRIRLDAVRASEQSLKDADALLKAGVGTKFDVLQAQVRLSADQQALVSAIGSQAVARRSLAQLLNLPQSVQPQAADPVQRVGDWNLSLDESIVLAFKNRAELQGLLEQRDVSKNRASVAQAATQPVLNLRGSSGLARGWSDQINTVGGLDPKDQRARPAQRVNQTNFGYDYSIGLELEWQFYDGGEAQARARQELLNAQIAEQDFNNTRTTIRLRVEEAFYGLQSNLSNIGTTYKGVEQAQEALRLARLRFQAGVGTQTDVINQQRDLTQAQGQYLSAITDYNKSLTDMKRAVSNWPPVELPQQANAR